MSNAIEIFVLVASGCIIVITIFIVTISFFAIKTIKKIRSTAKLLRNETEHIIGYIEKIEKNAFFLRRFAQIFFRRARRRWRQQEVEY